MKKCYIYYDKNGAFLGGLEKNGKPNDKNCKVVSKEEYIRILAENGIVYHDTTVKENPDVTTPTEETPVEAEVITEPTEEE